VWELIGQNTVKLATGWNGQGAALGSTKRV
jgi:hypothetical protein